MKSKRKNKKRHIRNKYGIILASILATAIAILILVSLLRVVTIQNTEVGRLVTFYDRKQQHVILTHATTVREALYQANIAISPGDQVEPAIDSTLLSSDSAVIIYRARPVLIVDGALRQKVVTPAAAPGEIVKVAGITPLGDKDEVTLTATDFIAEGASVVLTIKRAVIAPVKPVFAPTPNALTISKGAQLYTDSYGVAHRETYYDLPMNIVIGTCGANSYTIRGDGAKIDKDGYVLVAASYSIYPRCSVVETSLGPGKVYDTGGFALRYPHGFDLATDWTNNDGR